MEDFISKSCGDGTLQVQSYPFSNGEGSTAAVGPTSPSGRQDVRCQSVSSAHPTQTQTQMGTTNPNTNDNVGKLKKWKKSSKTWKINEADIQRKKRVVSYKTYTVEGKVKGSLKKSFCWVKDTYSRVVYGRW